jgi:raffinose/stachyose/melibiose transport system substrate-binding protein
MKKFLLVCSVILLIGFDLYAGGSSGAGKTTIRFATGTVREGYALDIQLREYQAEHPNVNLQIEEFPGNDLIPKINADIQANNCPDVFTYWRPETRWDFDKFIAQGAIADLGELKNSDFYRGMFPDYAWDTGTVNGMVVGIPRNSFYTAFLINKDIFQKEGIEPPTDWNKLVRACEQLKAKGYIPWAVDTMESRDDASRLFNACIEATIGNAKGLRLMQGLESWQQPDVIEALDYFLQVAKAGYAPEDSSVIDDITMLSKYFNTDRAGMVIQNAAQVWNNIPFDIRDKFEAYNFPLTPTTKMTRPFNELDLSNLVYASKKSFNDPAKKQAVIDLIHKITDRPAAKLLVEGPDASIVPHLGVTYNESKSRPVQNKAQDLANAADSCKWMLSRTTSNVVDDFRITINAVWYSEITNAQVLARRLDDNLYGKQQ